MDDHAPEVIIVRRRASHDEGHHGGAWKMAFADFMTAMMAFFLVLWILNATDKDTKTIIARYFNPVKLEESARTPKSIHAGDVSSMVDVEDAKNEGAQGAAGPQESTKTKDDEPAAAKSSEASQSADADKVERRGNSAAAEVVDPANPKPTMSEGVLFSDPYRSLDVIAGASSPDMRAIAHSEMTKTATETGPADPDAFRDPFRRVGPEVETDALEAGGGKSPPTPSAASPPPDENAKSAMAAPPSSGPTASEAQPPAATAARLQKELELQVGALGASRLGPAIDVKSTDEGLLISLTDRLNFSMFAIGSAEPQLQVLRAMDAIARSLKSRPGMIVVRGHTDAHPYKSATYDNWRLSSARAQVAYYMLTRAGLPESRFERIEGYADHRLRDPSHPFAAENRRIEILLREPKP
ncbi:MAG: flagellar motor protein MotB [Roseiarcus sp.]|jgi:chemotaxis protein MotB